MVRVGAILLDSIVFRRTCAKFATGVAVATVLDGDGNPHGMTVNSFTSVSLNPPMVLFCVDHSATLLGTFRGATHYGLSVLADSQQSLSNRFAQRGQDRFDGVEWQRGLHGVPLIPGALAHLTCAVRQVIEAGDHSILLAEVVDAALFDGHPLLYFDSAYRRVE